MYANQIIQNESDHRVWACHDTGKFLFLLSASTSTLGMGRDPSYYTRRSSSLLNSLFWEEGFIEHGAGEWDTLRRQEEGLAEMVRVEVILDLLPVNNNNRCLLVFFEGQQLEDGTCSSSSELDSWIKMKGHTAMKTITWTFWLHI